MSRGHDGPQCLGGGVALAEEVHVVDPQDDNSGLAANDEETDTEGAAIGQRRRLPRKGKGKGEAKG